MSLELEVAEERQTMIRCGGGGGGARNGKAWARHGQGMATRGNAWPGLSQQVVSEVNCLVGTRIGDLQGHCQCCRDERAQHDRQAECRGPGGCTWWSWHGALLIT